MLYVMNPGNGVIDHDPSGNGGGWCKTEVGMNSVIAVTGSPQSRMNTSITQSTEIERRLLMP
jgi:hypothetical protein